ncbi:MAG TPA: hypothetical protein DIT01_08440 [Lentisphaeria bacterium]|nr:hypothetical protein [Lentisphaeria bacterium]|tara:strand:+ start:10154 stop:11197 length:1044 start_codon:yes stop_codon:yes gene_type:complete
MKAILKDKQEPGLAYGEHPVRDLKPHEVLLQIHTATICGTDILIYHWHPLIRDFIKDPPFIPGHECGAVIAELGTEVRGFSVGDRVAVETHLPCGNCYQCRTGEQHICRDMVLFGHNFNGCFAEFAVVPQQILFKIDDALSLEKAALLEPMGVSFQGVEKAQVAGDSVAVIGAGPIGLFAIYLARKMGATRVIAIDINKFRLDLALQLGADTVFDPQQSNVPEEILALTDGDGVGRIIDAAGANESLSESFSYLRKGGRLILVGNPKQDLVIKSPMVSLVQKEITIKGVHGRRMYDTWEKTQNFLLEKTLPLELFVSHEFAMTDYDKAFAEIDSGRTSKVMLRNKHE